MDKSVRDLLNSRLDLGRSKYGHGVRIDSDTRDWGTKQNSWLEMMREEFLDGMIYCAADALRKSGYTRPAELQDDNDAIMKWIDDSILQGNNGESTDDHQEMLNILVRSTIKSLSME